MANTKIFVIGYNKSGTTTLHNFFVRNGISSAHWNLNGINIAAQISLNISKGKPCLDKINHVKAYSDMCFHSNHAWIEGADFFKEIYEEYPNAFYIYNHRDLENFIKSRTNQPYELERAMRYWACDENTAKNIWREMYIKHQKNVRQFFKNKRNFLDFNIETNSSEQLVSFLLPVYSASQLKYGHYKNSLTKKK